MCLYIDMFTATILDSRQRQVTPFSSRARATRPFENVIHCAPTTTEIPNATPVIRRNSVLDAVNGVTGLLISL